MKTKFSVRPGNTPLLHLERVALRRRLAKLWRLYSGIDYNGSAIRRTYYADLIGKVRAALKEKRRGKLRRGVLFHQDNTLPHTSSQALAAIPSAGFELLIHPPYTPELAPGDFYLFLKLKEFVKGRKFADDNEVIYATNSWLEGRDQQFFYNGIQGLEKR